VTGVGGARRQALEVSAKDRVREFVAANAYDYKVLLKGLIEQVRVCARARACTRVRVCLSLSLSVSFCVRVRKVISALIRLARGAGHRALA
jgi:hypothetical protein